MYRAYEKPRTLEDMLRDAKERLEALKWQSNADPEDLIRVHEEIDELRERVNFAWQDEEY